MLEIFSDIAYGATADHRSIQGLVVCSTGVPIAWLAMWCPATLGTLNCGVEPIAYCESLVVGKATAALLCCSNTFDRVIYGDNAAGIGLAHGVTTSSWRTRHLRVKVSVWREALRDSNINPGGCLKLLHLQSTELVADGCTKPLSGQAFFRFLEDFGIKRNYASTDGRRAEPEVRSACRLNLEVVTVERQCVPWPWVVCYFR